MSAPGWFHADWEGENITVTVNQYWPAPATDEVRNKVFAEHSAGTAQHLCARPGCGQPLQPLRNTKRYCNVYCRVTAWRERQAAAEA